MHLKMTLTARTADVLQPRDRPNSAWDHWLSGFGVRVHPSGLRSYFVNYRAGDRGRRARNRSIVLGRHGMITADQVHRRARVILG